jgi:metal transporter CNNM
MCWKVSGVLTAAIRIPADDFLTELIGEEIYDEFDAEGAQQLQAYTPAPRAATTAVSSSKAGDLKSILKRNGSAPDLTSAPVSASGPSVSVVHAAAPVSKSGSSTPSLRPLPALKNLSFFGARSRSAPPVPRPKVEKKATESPGSRTPEAASTPPIPSLLVNSTKLTAPIPLHTRISEEHVDPTTGLVHRSAPATPGIRIDSDPMETAPSSSTDPSSFVTAQTPVEASEYSAPAIAAPVPVPALPPSIAHSRAASPAPSIEAFIMGGKRRPSIAAGVGSGSALKERSVSIGQKGTRFKSSPLTGERGGVVIAEQVMKDLRGDRQSSNPDRVTADDDRAS